jgi:cellulose synthase/poly-beta-1,6-N-acetylglucosamine synthase-like glycosyltransferase
MIIDITRCNCDPGYLPKATQGFFNPFFAGANMAVRRQALEATGGFDPKCQTGEDVDLSIRISRAGWELWYEPAAVVNHRDPHTFRKMLGQWFGYGFGHPYVYKKHVGRPRLQFYLPGSITGNSRPYGARCVADLPFPFYGVVFLSAYHLFHFALLVLLTGVAAGSPVLSLIAAGVALAAGLSYATIRFSWRRPLRSIGMFCLRYSCDTAFVWGALLGGLRHRALFLEATRTR